MKEIKRVPVFLKHSVVSKNFYLSIITIQHKYQHSINATS